jgi:hypothetical protein
MGFAYRAKFPEWSTLAFLTLEIVRASHSERILLLFPKICLARPNRQIRAGYFDTYLMSDFATEALWPKTKDISVSQIRFDA